MKEQAINWAQNYGSLFYDIEIKIFRPLTFLVRQGRKEKRFYLI